MKLPHSTLPLLPLLLLAAGCSTYTYRSGMDKIHPAYAAGNFDAALAVTGKQIAKQTDGDLSGNALVWRVNHAAILTASGDFEAAEHHWESAEPLFKKAWENERVSVLDNSLGLFVPGVKDTAYYARPHEGVMLYTYRMLNALRLGDIAEARTFLRRSMDFRDEVIKEIEARVEKRRASGASDDASLTRAAVSNGLDEKPDTNTGTLRDDSLNTSGLLFSEVEKQRRQELREDLEGYANYANPLTGLLTWLFLRTQGTGLEGLDENNARREMEELGVFAPRNSVVRGIQETGSEPPANSVFVFFETGLAPRLEEKRIEIPIPTKYISYAGVAWPRLVPNPSFVPRLLVSTSDGKSTDAELLVNFDAVAQQSFDDAWPGIITHQIAQSVVNIAVNVAINLAAQKAVDKIKDPSARLLANIGKGVATAGLSYWMIEADTRSWELLPKQVHVARLEIPADRKITLSFPGGAWRETVTLNDGDVMAVWVKSTGPWQRSPTFSQFKFK